MISLEALWVWLIALRFGTGVFPACVDTALGAGVRVRGLDPPCAFGAPAAPYDLRAVSDITVQPTDDSTRKVVNGTSLL